MFVWEHLYINLRYILFKHLKKKQNKYIEDTALEMMSYQAYCGN